MFRQCFDRLEMSHDRSHVHAKICLAGQFTSIFIETRWFQQSRIYDSNSLFHAHLKLRLELRQGLEGGEGFLVPHSRSFILRFFFHRFPEFFFCFQKQQDAIEAYTCASWYHSYVRILFFLFWEVWLPQWCWLLQVGWNGWKRDVEPEWALLSMSIARIFRRNS